jgi:hypothetical protein
MAPPLLAAAGGKCGLDTGPAEDREPTAEDGAEMAARWTKEQSPRGEQGTEYPGTASRRRGPGGQWDLPEVEGTQLGRESAYFLNVTCVQCENGKSISPIDGAQPTMAHDADTDSDPALPPDGNHPSARHATPAMLLRSATRRCTASHVVAHPGSCDSE